MSKGLFEEVVLEVFCEGGKGDGQGSMKGIVVLIGIVLVQQLDGIMLQIKCEVRSEDLWD